jgi:type I restriction enzyme S subunit
MNPKWPLTRLGELVTHRSKFITIDDESLYNRCKVQLHAQGIILRDNVLGYEIKTKKQQLCKTDDFLVAEIDAKVGGYGIVPQELDGAIVSSHYFLYDINQAKLSPHYLSYFTKTNQFYNQVSAQGSTNYAAIRPNNVLEYAIPLPPLSEQRRIVERIDNAAEKIDAGKKLAEEVNNEINALEKSFLFSIFRMRERWIERQVKDICYHPQYGYTESATYEEVGPRFLRITDIQNGHVAWENVPFCNCPNPDKYLLQKNDILFTRTGATTGKSFLIEECPRAVFASYLIRLRL